MKNKRLVLAVEFGLLIGLIGALLYALQAPPRLSSIRITDAKLGQTYDVLADRQISPDNQVIRQINDRSSSLTRGTDRIVSIETREAPNTDVRYRVTLPGVNQTSLQDGDNKWLYKNRKVQVPFYVTEGSKSLPLKVEATRGRWREIWSGEVGKDTENARWTRLTYDPSYPQSNAYVSNLIDPADAKNVLLKVETDLPSGMVAGKYMPEARAIVNPDTGAILVELQYEQGKAKRVKILRQDYIELYNQPIAFGKRGDANDRPVTESKATIEAISDYDHDKVTKSWLPTGEPISNINLKTIWSLSKPSRAGDVHKLLTLFIPRNAGSFQANYIKFSDPRISGGGGNSDPLPAAPLIRLDRFFEVPSTLSKVDVTVLAASGEAKQVRVIKKLSTGKLTQDDFVFEAGSGNAGPYIKVMTVPNHFGRLVVHLKRGGYARPGEPVLTPYAKDWSEMLPSYVKPEGIDRIEVWACPAKTYTFKDVPLQPKP